VLGCQPYTQHRKRNQDKRYSQQSSVAGFHQALLSRRRPISLAPVAPVEYLEAALAFASSHDLGVAIAQLDLANRPAGCNDLPENYRRSLP